MTQRRNTSDDSGRLDAKREPGQGGSTSSRDPDWDAYSPQGHGRTDEQIRADIHEVLTSDKGHQALSTLSISVGDGIVTLKGQIPSEAEARRITEMIRAVPSVRDVQSQLRVASESKLTH